jgi:intracellular septation protein A
MEMIKRLLAFALSNFGPLIVFYGVNSFYGIRVAVIASITFSFLEIIYKLIKKTPFSGFFKFSVCITVVFGILDLCIQTPIFFKYEAAITNIITGIYFGMTLKGSRSFIQEWIEKKNGKPLTSPNSILRARILTVVWTSYFFIKAGFYTYIGANYSIEEAMLIRTGAGTISFYALLGVSIFFGRPILNFFQKRGLLPSLPN